MRFYKPGQSQKLLDALKIEKLNLKWLRRQILWSIRKNLLFYTTIQENVEYDLAGIVLKTESSQEK